MKRIGYELYDEHGRVVARLVTENTHPNINPEEGFVLMARASFDVNSLISQAMSMIYPSAGGEHRAGERMFKFSGTRDYDALFMVHYQQGESVKITRYQKF